MITAPVRFWEIGGRVTDGKERQKYAGNPLNSFQKSRYGMKNLVGKIKTLVVVNSCGIKQVVVVSS